MTQTALQGNTLVERYYTTNDPDVRELAVKAFVPLVEYILGKVYLPPNNVITRDDLRQSGYLGLAQALSKFDSSRNVGFKTFAYTRIYGAMIDCVRQVRHLPRVPFESMINLFSLIENLSHKLGREPEDSEICDALKIAPEELADILLNCALSRPTISLNDPIKGSRDGLGQQIDMIENENAEDPELEFMTKDRNKCLIKALQNLPERQQSIMALYYYDNLVLSDIGKIFGLSESRVSQIITKTRGKLRRVISKEGN